MNDQRLLPVTEAIDLKNLILPEIRETFKEMMLELLKPLHEKIEILQRNNNELVLSNNSMVKAVTNLKDNNASLSKRVVQLEAAKATASVSAVQSHSPDTTLRQATKNQPQSALQTQINRHAHKRTPTVMGSGHNVGAQRFLHIAITRLPLKDSITDEFLMNTINKEISSIGAKVTQAVPLRSSKYTDPPKTKSFKLTISYDGDPADIYKSHFYPTNVKVTRFNFPNDRRKQQRN